MHKNIACPLPRLLGGIARRRQRLHIDSTADFPSDGRARIYVFNKTCSRDAVAALSCMDPARTCMLVPQEEYDTDRILHTVSKQRIITAKGGVNTEWLHSALRRLKDGQSVLLFPDETKSTDAAAVLLAVMSGAEIVPMYSRAEYTPLRRRNIRAGKPLHPDGSAPLTADRLRIEYRRLRRALAELAVKGEQT